MTHSFLASSGAKVDAFLDDPDLGISFTGFVQIDADGHDLRDRSDIRPVHPDLFVAVFWANPINGSSVMMRRAVFDQVGMFDESLRANVDGDHADPLAPLPEGVEPGVVPVTPYAGDASGGLGQEWRARGSGSKIRVTTCDGGRPCAVRLRTYRDVVAEYRLHPEAKSGDPGGGPCTRATVGLLPRLDVRVAGVPAHIGKESNRLEEVEAGAVAARDSTYTVFRDDRAEWEASLPALRELRATIGWRRLAEASGLSERALRYAFNGGTLPRLRAREALLRLLASVARRRRRADLGLLTSASMVRCATAQRRRSGRPE